MLIDYTANIPGDNGKSEGGTEGGGREGGMEGGGRGEGMDGRREGLVSLY